MAAQMRAGTAGNFGTKFVQHNALDIWVNLSGLIYTRMLPRFGPSFSIPVHVDNVELMDMDAIIAECGKEHFEEYAVAGRKSGSRAWKVKTCAGVRALTRFHDLELTGGLGVHEVRLGHADLAHAIPPFTLQFNAKKRRLKAFINWAKITCVGAVQLPTPRNVSAGKIKRRAATAAKVLAARNANLTRARQAGHVHVHATRSKGGINKKEKSIPWNTVWPPPNYNAKAVREWVSGTPLELWEMDNEGFLGDNLDPRMMQNLYGKDVWDEYDDAAGGAGGAGAGP